MRKILILILSVVLLLCTLASCTDNEPIIEINADGYVVVNGITTDILADKEDSVTLDEEGYVIVNGVKTEYKIHTPDEISVNADGYVVVNGITTDILTDKDDSVALDEEGYVIVNGVKTEHQVAQKLSNEINYTISNLGTKIEALPLSEQQRIDDYVYDCKTVFSLAYAYRMLESDCIEDAYLTFTDVFVYDLSKIDEKNLDDISLEIWNQIKALNNGASKPVMYVELSGFCNQYPFTDYYRPIYFSETNLKYGYFIFENETATPEVYKSMIYNIFHFEMISGAEFINCGDKYSEEVNLDEAAYYLDFYSEVIQSGLFPEDLLKRLKPLYK